MNKRCVIVFPMYREPDEVELAFLEHGLLTLEGFDAMIAAPESLDTTKGFGTLSALPVARFNDKYFKGIEGYNRLLLSEEFYEAFHDYEYMLIHQADVYIFKNELEYWCSQGYSYIGPPWYRPKDHLLKRVFNSIRKFFSSNYGRKHNKVGNGGFSLRNVQKAIQVIAAPGNIDEYRNGSHHRWNEDVFWSFEANKTDPDFRIPDCKTALRFGIEFNPEAAYKEIGEELPFGCHAPLVHGREFWRRFIRFL